jgi:hypothetical protein
MSTYSAVLESVNSESFSEIARKDHTGDYIGNVPRISFPSNLIKIGKGVYEDGFHEIEPVEIPVVKRIVFQFKKPVKLDFS